MTAIAKDDNTRLPTQITRPLRTAAFAVFCGVILLSLWSIYAPLSTTLHASGTLISSSPSYEIQHTYGGEIENVAVNLHQNVVEDQVLITLDTDVQKRALYELEHQISHLMFENELISKELNLIAVTATQSEHSEQLAIKYAILGKKLTQEIMVQDDLIENNQLRVASIDRGIEILEQRRKQTFEKSQTLQKLVNKGAISVVETEENLDDLLSLDGQINSENALLTMARSEIEKARLDRARVQTQHRLTLIETLNQNNVRMPEIRRQILTLQTEIDSAIIRSPIDGTITF